MESSQARPVGLVRSLSILCAFSFLVPTQALYFFLEGGTQKCFYEELPKDTLVVGESTFRSNPQKFPSTEALG